MAHRIEIDGRSGARTKRLVLFVSIIALASLAAPAAAQVEITYLGNEGVLLRSAESAVLIDALHGPYKQYATAPADVRAAMEAGAAPYDADLVLVSHVHGDHFDPAMVAAHLQRNGKARLVTSDQAAARVRELLADAAPARSRIEELTPAPGTTRPIAATKDLSVKILGLPHGGRPWEEIRNFGHLVEIGGVKILHVGDADIDPSRFAQFHLIDEEIDVALLPDWYLAYTDGQKLVRELIRPRRLFAVHVADGTAEEVTARIRKAFPDATVFTKIGTKVTIPRRENVSRSRP